MDKQELALVVIDRLKKEYPDAGCTLDYDDAWKLLVSVRLAAQCTDARVNVVVEPGCQCTGRSHTGRDRRNCKTMRTGQE